MKKQYLLNILVVFATLLVGFGAGSFVGSEGLKLYLFRRAALPFFFPGYSSTYHAAVALMNSPDELQRLSGYYALIQLGTIDEGLLFKRLSGESNPAIKRSIVWILGRSELSKTAAKTLARIFDESSASVREEILRVLDKHDAEAALELKKKYKIELPAGRELPLSPNYSCQKNAAAD